MRIRLQRLIEFARHPINLIVIEPTEQRRGPVIRVCDNAFFILAEKYARRRMKGGRQLLPGHLRCRGTFPIS